MESKPASPGNVVGLISECFGKKSVSVATSVLESAENLFSFGESEFF